MPYDKKKDSMSHQEKVNKGLVTYQKTDTPGRKIGGQASMDSIAFDNRTIDKLNAKKTAVKNVMGNALKFM